MVTLTLRFLKSPNACTPIDPGMKYGDEMTTSLFDSMTRSMTFICALIDRAISADVAMTLAGLVGKRDRRAPDKPETSRIEIVAYRAITEDIERRHGDRHHLLPVVDQMVEAASRLFAVCGFAEDGFHRIDLRAVPVNVEDVGELTNDGTHDEYVHVDEVGSSRCA